MIKDYDTSGLALREWERIEFVIREYPEWQECQHGKRIVEVMCYWSDDAPFTVTTGRINSTQRFSRNLHTDGSPSDTFEYGVHHQCPQCHTLDSLQVRKEAWGDRTTCSTEGCDYTHWYSIGD